MSFNCSKCGLCCKNPMIANVCPELDRGDGVCIHLRDDNTCDIYDTRPDYCRIDFSYSNYFSDKMSLDEFYQWYEVNICNLLQTNGAELERYRQLNVFTEKLYAGEIEAAEVPEELREEVERRVANRIAFYERGGY